jgi:tetratricopeptide (TPR) repeat protein
MPLLAAVAFPALWIVGMLALGECTPAPAGDAAAEAADAYVAGVEHVAAERWADALGSFQRALDLDPGIPLAHYGTGQAQMALGRYAEAAAAFEASRDAFVCAGELSADARRAAQRRLDATLRSLRDSLRQLEQDRLLRSTIPWQEVNGDEPPRPGRIDRQREALEARLVELERLRARRRASGAPPEVALALGSAYFHTGDLARAEREFREALAADPDLGDAHNNLAVVLMLTGRIAEAERAVRAAERHGVAVSPRLKEELRVRTSARTP